MNCVWTNDIVSCTREAVHRDRCQEHAIPAIPMLLWCPDGHRHIDEGVFADKLHHTHACQTCGVVWRPAIVDTVGVQFLPGFKNVETATGGKG